MTPVQHLPGFYNVGVSKLRSGGQPDGDVGRAHLELAGA